MSDETLIDDEEARHLGVWTQHGQMSNGERRFRLKNKDGNDYIRTEATADSGWQKSHHHNNLRETYIVEAGRLALVQWINGQVRVTIHAKDSAPVVTTEPLVPHNVFMFPHCVCHTLKHGGSGGERDWHRDEFLDEHVLGLNEAKILSLAERPSLD